jgi:hypothetical protein
MAIETIFKRLGKLGVVGGGGVLLSVAYNAIIQFYPITGYTFISQDTARVLFWLFIAIGVAGVILIIIGLIISGKAKNESLMKPSLDIGAKITGIHTHDYYADVFGQSHADDKQIHLNVILSPSMPMTFNIVSLKAWGKMFDLKYYKNEPQFGLTIKKIAPLTIKEISTFRLFTDIPKELAINTEAQIYILISNQQEVLSKPFMINFEVAK